MKRIIAIILAALVALAAGGAVYYFFIYRNNRQTGTGRVSSTSEDAVYVDSVKIVAGLEGETGLIARYAGVVEPQETWEAKLESDKSVKKTYVKEGDEVKEGDKLFTYDTSEDEDKLAQYQIDLERNEAELENQKFQLESWEKQKPKDNASDDTKLDYTATLLQYQTDVKTTEYEIRQTKQDIASLKETLESADVLCELNGVVRKISNPNSSSNSYYGSDNDAYITVMAVGDFRVKGTINEQHVNDLSVGDAMLAFSRVDDQVWRGTLAEIKTDNGDSNQSDSGYGYYDSGSDNGSTNYPFYVELESSDGLLLGQHVYLEPDMGQDEKKDGIWIPEYYFEFTNEGDAWVWAASQDNKLEKRKVEVGEMEDNLDTIQVLSGLDADDYITVPEDDFVEGLPVIYVNYGDDALADLYGDDGTWDTYGDGSWYDDEMENVWYDDGSWFDDGSYYDEEDVWYDEGSYYVEDDSEEEVVVEDSDQGTVVVEPGKESAGENTSESTSESTSENSTESKSGNAANGTSGNAGENAGQDTSGQTANDTPDNTGLIVADEGTQTGVMGGGAAGQGMPVAEG